jgi:hypothetical protein
MIIADKNKTRATIESLKLLKSNIELGTQANKVCVLITSKFSHNENKAPTKREKTVRFFDFFSGLWIPVNKIIIALKKIMDSPIMIVLL